MSRNFHGSVISGALLSLRSLTCIKRNHVPNNSPEEGCTLHNNLLSIFIERDWLILRQITVTGLFCVLHRVRALLNVFKNLSFVVVCLSVFMSVTQQDLTHSPDKDFCSSVSSTFPLCSAASPSSYQPYFRRYLHQLRRRRRRPANCLTHFEFSSLHLCPQMRSSQTGSLLFCLWRMTDSCFWD